jgi:outer membrane immunogenic protein
MRKLLVSLCFIMFGATAVQADRPFTWTGFYVGVHGGFAGSTIDPLGPAPPSGAPDQNLEGGVVGLQLGYQYQWQGGIVTGVEADISFAHLNETVRDGNYLTQTGTISSFGTARVRLGWAMGPFMPFVTGGLAWDRMSQGQQCPDPGSVVAGHCNAANGFSPYNLTKTETNTGWVWGGGVDYRINHTWSFRVEGMRLEFEGDNYALGNTPSGKTIPLKTFDHHIDVLRFATNMKF